jgi:hypothetical protein
MPVPEVCDCGSESAHASPAIRQGRRNVRTPKTRRVRARRAGPGGSSSPARIAAGASRVR